MSRAAYARLYSAGFPQILDRHNNLPEVMDPSETIECINMEQALADPLQVRVHSLDTYFGKYFYL